MTNTFENDFALHFEASHLDFEAPGPEEENTPTPEEDSDPPTVEEVIEIVEDDPIETNDPGSGG